MQIQSSLIYPTGSVPSQVSGLMRNRINKDRTNETRLYNLAYKFISWTTQNVIHGCIHYIGICTLDYTRNEVLISRIIHLAYIRGVTIEKKGLLPECPFRTPVTQVWMSSTDSNWVPLSTFWSQGKAWSHRERFMVSKEGARALRHELIESWVFQYDPETKRQSLQRKIPRSPRSTK